MAISVLKIRRPLFPEASMPTQPFGGKIIMLAPFWQKIKSLEHFKNCIHDSNIFFQENAFDGVFCKTVAILFRPQCINHAVMDTPWLF